MPTLLSISDAADAIMADPAPVLCIDTCALLDTIRAPQRSEIRNAVMEATALLYQKAIARPPNVWIVVAPLVPKEWQDHAESIREGLDIHIKSIDEHVAALCAAMQVTLPGTPLPAMRFASFLLPAKLLQQAQFLLDSSIILNEDQACIMKARQRVAQDIPPATKGKSEFKDCEIVEHYLALCHHLQMRGFLHRRVFVSSNRTDYCDKIATSKLRPPLDVQFDAVHLRYAGDLAWAHGLL